MQTTPKLNNVSTIYRFSIGVLAVAGLAVAQDQAPHPWRSVNDPPPAEAVDQATLDQGANNPGAGNQNIAADVSAGPQNNQAPPPPPLLQQQQQGQYPPPPPFQGGQQQGQYAPPPPDNYRIPSRLTIKAGTYVTVRINEWLSSDRNQQGDAFTATLAGPIVVDGIVVAQPGQTVAGEVTEAKKAGRVEGTSRLGVKLTELTLVDGQQELIRSQMINQNGPTSVGRDAAAIGGTTALGAAIGAGVDWGRGAAIGAGAGAAAGIIGVLLTRGRPTVIYPESVLTFRLETPVAFSTDRAPQAFRYVDTQDYGGQPSTGQPSMGQRPPAISGGPVPPPAYGYGYGYPAPYPYSYGYGYGYPYPFYGGFSVFVGPRYGYYGGGYRGGYYRGGYSGAYRR